VSRITVPIDDDMILSIYQNDDTGQLECLPMSNGVSGKHTSYEPVFFSYAEELEDIITMCRHGNYKVFEYDEEDYQIVLNLEVVSNDNQEGESSSKDTTTDA